MIRKTFFFLATFFLFIILLFGYFYFNAEYPKSLLLGRVNLTSSEDDQLFTFICPLNNYFNFSFAFDSQKKKTKYIVSTLNVEIKIYNKKNKLVFFNSNLERNMVLGNWHNPKISIVFLGFDKELKTKLIKGDKYKIKINIKNSSKETVYADFYLNYLDKKYNN